MRASWLALAVALGAGLAMAGGLGGGLGARAVAWCRAEMAREPVPSAATVAGWFSHAMRNGRPLGIATGNHCAIAQCAAMRAALRPGETPPHGCRAGSRELEADARAAGRWLDVQAVRQGARPAVGDVAIYDRSDPARPETAWQGHADRVTRLHPDGYDAIGANGPGRAWYERRTAWADPRLLGFVRYGAG